MFDKRIEISVTIEEQIAVLDTSSGDQSVDGLTNCHALSSQNAEVSCGLNGDISPAYIDYTEGGH